MYNILFGRRITIKSHSNDDDNPIEIIQGILVRLLGECGGINFWEVRNKKINKCLEIQDKVLREWFKACVVAGLRSELLDCLKSFELKTDGSEGVGEALLTYIIKVVKAIDTYERGLLVMFQVPRGIKRYVSAGVSNSKRCEEEQLIRNDILNIKDVAYGVNEFIDKPYERLGIICDKLYITFIYYRSLIVPPVA